MFHVTDLQFLLPVLPSEILDISIEGANFRHRWEFVSICPFVVHFYISSDQRGEVNCCDSFFARVINYYCLQNILSCRNVAAHDVLFLDHDAVVALRKCVLENASVAQMKDTRVASLIQRLAWIPT